jgi:hypothetical protein
MRHQWAFAALAAAITAFGIPSVSSAAPFLIDDFASQSSSFYIVGSPAPVFYPNGKPVENAGLESILGGERDTLVNVLGTPAIQSAQFLLGVEPDSFPTGVFHLATAGNPASVATLQYDGDDVDGDALTNAKLLDFSMPASGSFQIDFLSIDSPGSPDGLKVDILLTSIGGGSATFNDFAPETSEPSTFTAPIASFLKTPEFDAAHISSITFVLNQAGLMDTDFTIDNLRAVPEPSAFALAALAGIAAIAWRRRVRA